MNWLWIPTVLLAFVCFAAGLKMACVNQSVSGKAFLLALGLILGAPGILIFAYYFKFLQNEIWFFQFRALPGSELTASGLGFPAGLLHGYFAHKARFGKFFSRGFLPAALIGMLMVPYLKPVLLPARWEDYENKWSEGVCLQSSSSSCGAASAATLLRLFGKPADERAIAREAFTSFTGTENWYLARVFRKRGLSVHYIKEDPQPAKLPYPSISGVRVENTGHFITILGKEGGRFAIGDPMTGRELFSEDDLRKRYHFTGFFMVISQPD